MKVKYMINNNTVNIINLNDETAIDILPPRVYTVRFTEMGGFFLDIIKSKLDTPKKVYGGIPSRVEKCIKTYQARAAALGILLTGDKGTGKSLLVAALANAAIEQLAMPVILIKEPFGGTQFTSFIESIGECCLIFDEFGKMYPKHAEDSQHSQQSLLSLMDGVDKAKRLIIMSENHIHDINEFILNRPSRVYYHFKYYKLEESSIIEYCNDQRVDMNITKEIIDLSRRARIFSFDMLKSISEEHLRFVDVSLEEIVEDLNIDISEQNNATMEIIEIFETVSKAKIELFNPKSVIVQKPHRYNNTYIKISENETVQDNRIATPISTTAVITKEIDGPSCSSEIVINQEDLVFSMAGKEIYETEKYTIITKPVANTFENYSLLV